jgi:hypothetical protein
VGPAWVGAAWVWSAANSPAQKFPPLRQPGQVGGLDETATERMVVLIVLTVDLRSPMDSPLVFNAGDHAGRSGVVDDHAGGASGKGVFTWPPLHEYVSSVLG